MKNKYISQELADFYSALQFASIPENVLIKARKSLVDFLGVLILGYREGLLPPIIDNYLDGFHSRKESTLLSRRIKTSAVNAAMSMGVASHSVELDDGYRFGTSHPAVVVIPAALAVCEREGKSFCDLLKAIIIGYDVMLRISRSINPSHWRRGYHSTSTCGVFGSAFSCASLLDLDAKSTANAASIAALQSAGLQEMLHNNPSIKPFQVGKASANGVMSADLVNLGAKGPNSIFEGKHGWLKAVTDDFNENDLFINLGSEFEIMKTYTKIYPTCRHCHAAIELAVDAQTEIAFNVELIDSITVKTYDIAIAEVGELFFPESYDDAMFSLPFSIALAIKYGSVAIHDFNENNYYDPEIKEIQRKIIIEPDQKMNQRYPEERGALMRIITKTGLTWEKQVVLPKGEPERPLTDDDLKNKLVQCVTPYYQAGVVQKIWKLCVEDDIQKVTYNDIIELLGRNYK